MCTHISYSVEDEIAVPIMYGSYFINNYVTKLKEVVCIIMVHCEMMNHRPTTQWPARYVF